MRTHTNEIRGLTGLRGIAALTVAITHYGIADFSPAFKLLTWSDAAVDLFFCLSGFTLCVAYRAIAQPHLRLRQYFIARIARIYPLYLLSLGAFVLFAPARQFSNRLQQGLQLRDFLGQALMINAWPVIGTGIHWNFPTWSVSVEFFCYLFVFPSLFYLAPLVARLDWRIRLTVGTGVLAASCALYFHSWDALPLILTRWTDPEHHPLKYSVPVARGVLGMIAGWLFYCSYEARDRLWRIAIASADFLALVALAILVCGGVGLISRQWAILIFPLLILGLTADKSFSAKLLSSAPVHYLGSISYSIYLLHIPCYFMLGPFGGLINTVASHHPRSFLILLAGLFATASLSYRFIELPLRTYFRRVFDADNSLGPMGGAIRRSVLVAGVGAFIVAQASWAGLLRPTQSHPVAFGADAAKDPIFRQVAGPGWSDPEDWGTWSIGRVSVLNIPLAASPHGQARLHLKGVFFVTETHPAVALRISANGIVLGEFEGSMADSQIDRILDLPPAVFAGKDHQLDVTINVDNPVSPRAMGLSDDGRVIGFGLKSLVLLDGMNGQ